MVVLATTPVPILLIVVPALGSFGALVAHNARRANLP